MKISQLQPLEPNPSDLLATGQFKGQNEANCQVFFAPLTHLQQKTQPSITCLPAGNFAQTGHRTRRQKYKSTQQERTSFLGGVCSEPYNIIATCIPSQFTPPFPSVCLSKLGSLIISQQSLRMRNFQNKQEEYQKALWNTCHPANTQARICLDLAM